jgi:hypothetical protein
LRDYFGLPDFLIQKAIVGTWHDAASELRRIPRIVLAGEASHLQYQALIAQVVVSDLPPEACAQIIASIGAAQVGQAKPPGGRPRGRRSEHDVRMELYQKWRACPPGRGAIAAFIRAVADKQVRIECWGDAPPSEEGITSHLRIAREWLAPRRDTVPATPRAYLPPMGE